MATLDLDILQGSLEKLVDEAAQISGAAIVSPDGLILVSTFPDRDYNDRLGAMTSELLAGASMTSRELDMGDRFLSISLGTTGGLIVRAVDDEMVITVQVKLGANIGKVVADVNQTANRLKATA